MDVTVTIYALWKTPSFKALLAVSLVVAAICATLSYWITDTEPPYTYHGEKSYILPHDAVGGDQMTVYWRVTINRKCKGFTQRILFDPRTGVNIATYDAAPMVSDTNIVASLHGEGPWLVRSFLLPQVIQKGVIGYRSAVCYSCNPLQEWRPVCMFTPDLMFEVRG